MFMSIISILFRKMNPFICLNLLAMFVNIATTNDVCLASLSTNSTMQSFMCNQSSPVIYKKDTGHIVNTLNTTCLSRNGASAWFTTCNTTTTTWYFNLTDSSMRTTLDSQMCLGFPSTGTAFTVSQCDNSGAQQWEYLTNGTMCYVESVSVQRYACSSASPLVYKKDTLHLVDSGTSSCLMVLGSLAILGPCVVPGTSSSQWYRNNTDMTWRSNATNNSCLTFPSSMAVKTLTMEPCGTGSNQQWLYSTNGTLCFPSVSRSVDAFLCSNGSPLVYYSVLAHLINEIDDTTCLTGDGPIDGVKITQSDVILSQCTPQLGGIGTYSPQNWWYNETYHSWRPAHAYMNCLVFPNESNATNLRLELCMGYPNQQWTFMPNGTVCFTPGLSPIVF